MSILLYVNGSEVTTAGCDPGLPLVKFIRGNLALTGTKENCHGGCVGACTVLLSRWCGERGSYEHRAVSSCSLALGSLHRTNITTVEGVGTVKKPHLVQQRLHDCHAVQCGYDTPGLVMAMYALLVQYEDLSMEDLINGLCGNVSRCNGYRAVLEAFKVFTEEPSRERESFEKGLSRDLKATDVFPLHFEGEKSSWTIVEKVKDSKEMIKDQKEFFYGNPPANLISDRVVTVKKSNNVTVDEEGVTFNSNITITNLIEELLGKKSINPLRIGKLTGLFGQLGSAQWRNSTSFQDAVLTNPDVLMIFTIIVKEVQILSLIHKNADEKRFNIDGKCEAVEKFLLSGSSLILSCTVFWPADDEIICVERITNRKRNGGGKIHALLRLLPSKDNKVEKFTFVAFDEEKNYFEAKNAQAKVKDKEISSNLFKEVEDDFDRDLENAHVNFERNLMKNILRKMIHSFTEDNKPPTEIRIGATQSQVQDILHKVDPKDVKALGKPFPHVHGLLCATGEAQFTDDIPKYKNELYMEFVNSTKAHAKLLKVDPSKALKIPGVKHFISAKDVPAGKNKFATFGELDDNIFAEDTVEYDGHPIGAILAVDEETAKKAASLVEIEYEEMPPVVSIQDALAADSFYPNPPYFPIAFTDGDTGKALAASDYTHEGKFQAPRQEHFYEETFSIVAVPEEDGQLKIFCPTQFNLGVQNGVANVLGIPANRVTISCKRTGCSYGGKCFRPYGYVFAGALAAHIAGKPIRNVLNRTQDIQMTGQRGEIEATYKVGVSEGKMKAVEVNVYQNGGWSSDCSQNILECILFHISSVYKAEAYQATGKVAKTNTPSNTAFRGYGCPQGIIVTENMIDDVAEELGIDQVKFRKDNYIKSGEKTHYGQVTRDDDVTMDACMDECIKRSNYYSEKQEVKRFNAANKFRKRGISLLPMRYGVGIAPMYAQSAALINVHLDGSVNLFVGGIEMGQGFYTKMMQIVSQELEIPMERIHIAETGTDKIPNPQMTGASSTADLNGNAVRKASLELKKRLAPFKEAKPDGTWGEWVGMAWASRVGLSVAGHWAQEASFTGWTGYDKEGGYKKEGNRWAYFVTSATAVIVELDVLTGMHQLLKTYIVMDLGEALNPAIDIVQIEGGFMQGYGWVTMEDTEFETDGKLKSTGHDKYACPTIADIPPVFDVGLLRKKTPPEHTRVVYSSKNVGEMPVYCGSATTYLAIKSAVRAARKELGNDKRFNLITPTTPINVINAIHN
eukprot:GFUD01027803.1.p1 GENE.GFUD01027803.1~~GFUD01027803.1.p1  ORF type:complete len:1247 (+),score=295.15 GFUD01027803.1:47-3787(+)